RLENHALSLLDALPIFVESKLSARMTLPVFHDDQHGTAIVVAAAVLNGLALLGKDIAKVKLVSTGGGAAGIACLNQLVALGLKRSEEHTSELQSREKIV